MRNDSEHRVESRVCGNHKHDSVIAAGFQVHSNPNWSLLKTQQSCGPHCKMQGIAAHDAWRQEPAQLYGLGLKQLEPKWLRSLQMACVSLGKSAKLNHSKCVAEGRPLLVFIGSIFP